MDKTAVQAPAGVSREASSGEPPRARQADRPSLPRQTLTTLASLRLTVWLFALSMALVFFGTLAQVDEGIWTVLNKYFRSGIAWIPIQALVRFAQVFLFVSPKVYVAGSFPFPGGWTLGGLLLVNLLAAHLVRFKLSWRRSGVLILHTGIVVMMLGELVTGLFAVEGRMALEGAGGTSNYVEHHDELELAVIDPSDEKVDRVTAVPGSLLRRGGPVSHADLPFDVEVKQYMVNSELVRTPPAGQTNPATEGSGLDRFAQEKPQVSGASGDKADVASAYVTLKQKDGGQPLGTYLVSLWLGPQDVTVGGKTYEVVLRSRRTYKPYSLQLLEFRHDLYPGTTTPRNFSSLVRLTDPTRDEDRTVNIYMNNPLRYGGETFYQSSFIPGDRPEDPDKGTILQVVRNPGWLMPYFSCLLVTVGMLVHFGLHLVGFIRRRAAL